MKELNVEASLDNLDIVTEFVDEQISGLDLGFKAQMQIEMAIEELFSNIAKYAYTESGPATVRVEVKRSEFISILITFIDNGVPYDPLAKNDPDLSPEAKMQSEGGLGIFMVKRSMDDVEYEYKNGQNILTVLKKI